MVKKINKLSGKSVYLSAMQKSETDFYFELYQNLDIEIGLGKVKALRYHSSQEFILEEIVKDQLVQHFTIYSLEKNIPIGSCGFYDIDFRNEKASVVIALDKKNKEKGVSLEAMCLLLDYGFYFLSLNKIGSYIYEYNKGALKMCKKLGFKNVGKERSQIKIGKIYYDRIIMDILNKEYYELHPSLLAKKLNLGISSDL